jgi:hypothetical protein
MQVSASRYADGRAERQPRLLTRRPGLVHFTFKGDVTQVAKGLILDSTGGVCHRDAESGCCIVHNGFGGIKDVFTTTNS